MIGLLEYLQTRYGQQALEWEDEQGDKRYFSLLYTNMTEGLRAVAKIDNMYVKVSMHLTIAEDEMKLKRILEKFK